MKRIGAAVACGAVFTVVPTLAHGAAHPSQGIKGPPTTGFYNGGKGNGMQARVVRQDAFTFHGHRSEALIDDVTVRDCEGSHVFVTGADAGPLRDGHASFSGRGARVRHFDGREPFLHSYKHVSGTLTLHSTTGSITYKVAGCPRRTLRLTKIK